MKRKITYASARNKGKTTERFVAKALTNIGIDAKRVPMSGALSWLKGDVVEFNSAHPHLHECKNQEQLSLNTWWQQAVEQCVNGEVPVLHFTSNYQELYTMVDSETFDELSYAYEESRRSLDITIIDLPPRRNFWKFTTKLKTAHTVFVTVDERVIMLFSLYLMLRRADIKVRAQSISNPID